MNNKKLIVLLVIVLIAVLMTACGDGGSVLDYNPVEMGMQYIDAQNCGALEFGCK